MKDFLSAKGMAFTGRDVAGDPSAGEELVSRYGRMATPTIIIGDKIFLGFQDNRAEIEKALDKL
ncbi:MAG: glutaredoxin domain-containing protein [Nitrospirota bacterium]|nr:glutaredoxin domain-containing protein [Nitrospirota bacterium]